MKRGKCAKCTNGAFPSAGPEKMRQTKHFLDGGPAGARAVGAARSIPLGERAKKSPLHA